MKPRRHSPSAAIPAWSPTSPARRASTTLHDADGAKGPQVVHRDTARMSVSAALAPALSHPVIAAAPEGDRWQTARRPTARPSRPASACSASTRMPGEDGLFGDDDERVTKPAVARTEDARHRRRRPGRRRPAAQPTQARRLSRHVPRPGPHPDQADLAAARLGLTASALPVLFAALAHGCAFDIAGKSIADPTGVIETIELLAGAA